MSYDYHAGATHTGFNAPLFAAAKTPTPDMNVDASTRMVLAAGVPPHRLGLGLPFYGRADGDVPAENDGLFQPAGADTPASWDGADGIDYRDLVARRPTRHGFVLRRDPDARVPWLYNPHNGIWISYDDPASIEAKCDYVRSHGLAGVMIWHVGADDGSLLRSVLNGLAPPASPRARPRSR
jgi:chitinase